VRIGYFAAAAAALMTVVLLVSLAKREPRLAASNSRIIISKVVVPVAPRTERCQGGEYVPADAARMRLYPSAAKAPAPALLVTLRDAQRRQVARLRVAEAYRAAIGGAQGPPLDLALPKGHATVGLGTLCIRNLGREAVGFAGNLTSINPASPGGINSPGERGGDEVRADYFLPGQRSGFSVAGQAVDRAALLRPGFMGPWTIWLALALFLAACIATITWLVRHLESDPA
jgi:hypothetical protein